MTNPKYISQYWGKAPNLGDPGPQYHPLPYHSLDVAAVASALLNQIPNLCRKLSTFAGIDNTVDFGRWMMLFCALHDIGKFTQSFQNLRPDLLMQLQGKNVDQAYIERHDVLGYLLWKNEIRARFIELELLKISGSRRKIETTETIPDIWMAIVTGHHGKPPHAKGTLKNHFYTTADTQAIKMFLDDLIILFFGTDIQPLNISVAAFKRASWWLAGLTILCDWLGSRREWFPYCDTQMSLSEYWNRSLSQADRAIAESGLGPATPSKFLTLSQLLNTKNAHAVATPLQHLSQHTPLSSQQLIILEDVTGAGKTEAALLLAHRMMAEHDATGIYIGLPTMATANGIYRRIASMFPAFFDQSDQSDQSCKPSLVLAHGARDMNSVFRNSISNERNYKDNTESATVWCSQWFADNTKKALLANMGVGTIDQALLAILPSKFQSLRLFGLFGKVLIVDEVHACDAYMHKLLGDLLTFHAAAGGNVILLSATLSQNQRMSLVSAFAEGLQQDNELPKINVSNAAYPLLTQYSKQGVVEHVVSTRTEVRRHVDVKTLTNLTDVETIIAQTVSQDRCVCWIRNTVLEACQAANWLKQRHIDWNVGLFHARYALADRLKIENDVLNRFGPQSTGNDRTGHVLIATQVVQESLDLDFDNLITDFAPIDLIVQRAGRLRRHIRDNAGNRIDGADQRGTPTLFVYGPQYTDTPAENWISSILPGTSYIYPDHGQLWLTARWLFMNSGFDMPEDARAMIESVYSEQAQDDIPDALLGKSLEAEGERHAEASQAARNLLKLNPGYQDIGINQWWDESITPTRLGECTTLVFLARWESGTLTPFRAADDFEWHQNSLRIRTYWIKCEAEIPEIPIEIMQTFKYSLPGKGKWGVLLPLIQNTSGQWVGYAKNQEGRTNMFMYNELGLLSETDIAKGNLL